MPYASDHGYSIAGQLPSADPATRIYVTPLFPLHVVVDFESELYLVPCHAGGWDKRRPLLAALGVLDPLALHDASPLFLTVGIPRGRPIADVEG